MKSEGKKASDKRHIVRVSAKTKALLHQWAQMYERSHFLQGDPSYMMHQVCGKENQEVMALLAACLSYGSREQFLPKLQLLCDLAKHDPYRWVASGAYEHDISPTEKCFYRLHTCRDLHEFLSSLRLMLEEYGSIEQYLQQNNEAGDCSTALSALTRWFSQHGSGHLVPKNTQSACKRLCMFMRWMCRNGSEVDLGLWADWMDKKTLIMPLDTHVMRLAKELRLINTQTQSMHTALFLTQIMRRVFPDDPLRGDFALFGYGISRSAAQKKTITPQ